MGTCLAPCDRGQDGAPPSSASTGSTTEISPQADVSKVEQSQGSLVEPLASKRPEAEVLEQVKEDKSELAPKEPTVVEPIEEKTEEKVMPAETKAGDDSVSKELAEEKVETPAPARATPPTGLVTADGRVIIGRSLPFRKPDSADQAKETSWSTSPGSEFKVRCGPDYSRKKLKAESAESLYECLSVEILKSDGIIHHLGHFLDWESAVGTTPVCSSPLTTLPYVFVVNAQLPDASEGVMSSLWGSSSSVVGSSLVGIFRIKPEIAKLAAAGPSAPGRPPAIALLERFVKKGRSDKELPFKAIGMVDNIGSLDVPGIVKQYNGKPALVTKSAIVYSGEISSLPGHTYMEVDFDTRKWSMLARTSMKTFKDRTKDLTLRMAYLVEAEKDAEMPEQIMGSAVVSLLDAERDAKYVPGLCRPGLTRQGSKGSNKGKR